MFWSKDKKKAQKGGKKAAKGNSATAQKPSSETIRAQAMANARNARAHIGEDTLHKIAEMKEKKQNSAMEQAKNKIHNEDADRVASEILAMLGEED